MKMQVYTKIIFAGKFEMPTAEQILFEMRKIFRECRFRGTVFRSNHASNYVLLGGTLNRDKEALIAQIDETLKRKEL